MEVREPTRRVRGQGGARAPICAVLLGLVSISACHTVAPEAPLEGHREMCCKAAAADNVSFVGCRATAVCRATESVWVRGPLECTPVGVQGCEGGRCCSLVVEGEPARPPNPPALDPDPAADSEPPEAEPVAPGRAPQPLDATELSTLPRPVAVPKMICPGVSERGVEGKVELAVLVDVRGSVAQVELREGFDSECDAIAEQALRNAHFKPASDLQGVPAAFWLRYNYSFVLVGDAGP